MVYNIKLSIYNQENSKQDFQIKYKMKYKTIIFVLFLGLILEKSTGFIIQGRQGYRRCFKAQHSPDKTLQVKFGFPRSQKQNCDVLFSVDIINQGKFKSNIYSDMHKCHQMTPGHPTVIKHTSESYSSGGFYQICAEVIQNTNQELLLEIFIGQKLNPLLYSGGEVLPLIQAQELIDLDLKVQGIRKSLGWSRKLLAQAKKQGDRLEANITQVNQFSVNATLLQIVFLVIYAVFWLVLMKLQKAN